MRSERRRTPGSGCRVSSFSMLQTDSSRCCQNFEDANEVVGGRGQYKEPLHQASASIEVMTGLAQPADRLDPAERLLDPLSPDGADEIAGMAGGARIDCRGAMGIVLGDMRGAAALATARDKVSSVVVLVAAHCCQGWHYP